MKKVASRDPDLIIFKSGGGWLLLIGIPILLFGLFFLVAAGAHIIAVVFYPEAEKLDEMIEREGLLPQ